MSAVREIADKHADEFLDNEDGDVADAIEAAINEALREPLAALATLLDMVVRYDWDDVEEVGAINDGKAVPAKWGKQ